MELCFWAIQLWGPLQFTLVILDLSWLVNQNFTALPAESGVVWSQIVQVICDKGDKILVSVLLIMWAFLRVTWNTAEDLWVVVSLTGKPLTQEGEGMETLVIGVRRGGQGWQMTPHTHTHTFLLLSTPHLKNGMQYVWNFSFCGISDWISTHLMCHLHNFVIITWRAPILFTSESASPDPSRVWDWPVGLVHAVHTKI